MSTTTRGFTERRRGGEDGRLPPGQHWVGDFPVLSLGPTPAVATGDWSLTLKVGPRPVRRWSWEEVNALPRTAWTRDIHCVTTWSKLDAGWEGVLFDDLLAAAPPEAPAVRGPAVPSPWRAATVTALAPLTPSIRFITLDVPGWPGHRAGQHVTLRLTAPDGYQAKRDYSLASAAEEAAGGDGRLELAVDLLPDGEVSPFLHEVLAVGDALELCGPLGGHFVWEPADGGPVLLVGGGSGVVPLMAMLRERALRARAVPMALLMAARTWDDVPFRDELLAMDGRGDGAAVVLALSREAPRRPGDLGGRIGPEAVARTLARLPAPPRYAYVCGSTGFVEAAARLALAAGLPATNVRTERYGGV